MASQSKVVACWVCPQGHHTEAPVYRKTALKSGCAVCSNKTILTGFNDMATVRPELVEEWDFDSNGDVNPSQIFPGSDYVAHWICPQGHRYAAKVSNRATGQRSGCGICLNKVVLPGINDLQSQSPQLMAEWDWEANLVDPSTLSPRSSSRAGWVCKQGHRWIAQVSKRAIGQGCPICSNRTLLSGFNDLVTVNPQLAMEWDYSRNQNPPQQYLSRSGFKVWWKCGKGHSWKTSIDKRASGQGCERCQKRATSIIEQAIFDAFSATAAISAANNGTVSLPIPWRTRSYMRVDMSGVHSVLGDIAVEYDGSYYHADEKSVRRDFDKTVALLGAGYCVIRVRENDLSHLEIDHPKLTQVSHRYGVDDPAETLQSALSQFAAKMLEDGEA